MLTLELGSTIGYLAKDIDRLRAKSVAYVTARSMTTSAEIAIADLQIEAKKDLHRPTQWTLNSVFRYPFKVVPANLTIRFGFKDRAASGTPAGQYLNTLVIGDRRPLKPVEEILQRKGKIPRNSSIIPIRSEIQPFDEHGNLPGSFYRALVARLIEESRDYFIIKSLGKNLKPGIYKRVGSKKKGRQPRGYKQLFTINYRLPFYTAQFPIPKILQTSFMKNFEVVFAAEIRNELEVYGKRG
jgi:hypothetical protein